MPMVHPAPYRIHLTPPPPPRSPLLHRSYVRSQWPLQALGMQAVSDTPLVTIGSYLRFWGWAFAAITLLVGGWLAGWGQQCV